MIQPFIIKMKSTIYKIRLHIIVFITFTLSFNISLSAQETMVVGQVVNASDGTPIPQVNITFKNTENVVQSNDEGYFLI